MNEKVVRAAREIRDPEEVMCGNCQKREWWFPKLVAVLVTLWAVVITLVYIST